MILRIKSRLYPPSFWSNSFLSSSLPEGISPLLFQPTMVSENVQILVPPMEDITYQRPLKILLLYWNFNWNKNTLFTSVLEMPQITSVGEHVWFLRKSCTVRFKNTSLGYLILTVWNLFYHSRRLCTCKLCRVQDRFNWVHSCERNSSVSLRTLLLFLVWRWMFFSTDSLTD